MGPGEGRQRVLIVDDDEVSCRVTAVLFQARGWNVETACDLSSAIDVAMRQQPHVIVTELLLPDVQSLQFVRALRSAVEHDTQIVALTRAGSELFDQARRDGFDLTFSKPLDIDEVERHVRRTTRMHKLEL
jgi:CheY-like chemotaxis protein